MTRVVSRNGRSIRVVDQPKKGGGWVATFEDITEWQQAQEQITHMARHDALTNLPNRTLFREQLEQALRLASAATSSRCSASISTISRKSTTRSVIRSATRC